MVPKKQLLRCEANYQRRIYYSIALTRAQFSTAVTNRCDKQFSDAQSTRYWLKQSSRKFPGQNTDLFFWINKVSDVSFSNSEQACLRCAGLHAAWHLSLGSYHTETHHYSPLLLRIKIIIVKFLLTITTLKIQSNGFSIKRARKRPTDCGLQQTLAMYYHTWRWNVIKDSKFQPSLVDEKVFKMWVLQSTS